MVDIFFTNNSAADALNPGGITTRFMLCDAIPDLHTDYIDGGVLLNTPKAMSFNFWVPVKVGGSWENRTHLDRTLANMTREEINSGKCDFSNDDSIEVQAKENIDSFITKCREKFNQSKADEIVNEREEQTACEKTLLFLKNDGSAVRTTGQACVFLGGRTVHSAVKIYSYKGEEYGALRDPYENNVVFRLCDVCPLNHYETPQEATQAVVQKGEVAATFKIPDNIEKNSIMLVDNSEADYKVEEDIKNNLAKNILEVLNASLVLPASQPKNTAAPSWVSAAVVKGLLDAYRAHRTGFFWKSLSIDGSATAAALRRLPTTWPDGIPISELRDAIDPSDVGKNETATSTLIMELDKYLRETLRCEGGLNLDRNTSPAALCRPCI